MQLLEGLKLVRDQIAIKEEWFQGSMFSPDGKKCCLLARVNRLNSHDYNLAREVVNCLRDQLIEMKESPEVAFYNDHHKHEEVLEFLNIVVKNTEAKQNV